ncbi:unnamed protein product, partial [Closterium sp. NIES-54]
MPTAFKFYPDSYFPSTSFPCPNLFVTLSLQRLLYATDSSPTALLRFLPAQATTPAMDNAATSAHPPAAATAGAAAADCRMALATQGRLLPLRVRQLASHVMIDRDPTTGTCQGSCACVHVELARPALRGLARRGRGREGRGAGREEEEAEAGEDEGRWGALFDLEALRDVVVPSVLNTLVAGSTGIQAARIQWQDGDDSNSSSNSGGHLALATSLSSSRAVWPSIAAACAAADCSDSIDWTKSRPEGLQQIADSLGIEAARSVLFH